MEHNVQEATGRFIVRLTPLDGFADGVGRMSIEKQFLGDLEATSRGEMLSLMTAVEGSAGYVAMEVVQGTLKGRQGSFALQHFGVMSGGSNRLILEVVPDSAAGELEGLVGVMSIDIVDGLHTYTLTYTLP